MVIYSIKVKSSKNTNIFTIESTLGEHMVHSDCIVKYGLKKGAIEDNVFFDALEESGQIIAFNLAAKFLASSMKTEKQLKDYLYKKEFKTNTINAVVKKLKEYQLIDDQNFAKSYIKSNPNFSANKLKQKLFGFGVSKQAVEELLTDFDDFDGCERSALKFMKNKPADQKTKEKLIRFLVSRGYNWNTISKVLNNLNFAIEFNCFD